MQQPMSQQEQLGCQQSMQQQMVLCPVRFVYETQILVPPGDQIQPNQTFIINPQNPPPWVQNRPVQNQVLYVQQLPNNILQSPQQHIDQNQLYLQQNFGNYQLQPQMITQNQEIRPLANMMPNMVQNIQQNIQNESIGQRLPNTNQIQNAQMIQNQISINRQIQNQNLEVQRQYMRPQMAQQTISRPIMTMNQIQNMQIQQTLTNMPNTQQVNFGQTFMPNVGQPRPVTPNISIPRNFQPGNVPNSVNMPNVHQPTKVRDAAPMEVSKTVNNNIGSGVPIPNMVGNPIANGRNLVPNYAYIPIQPRPQMRQNSTQVQVKPLPVQNSPVYVAKSIPQTVINVPNNPHFSNTENIVNRKRKSESPDEIQKKIAVTSKHNYNNVTQCITVTKLSNEVGVNTSPVHRIDNKNVLTNNTMLQISSNNAQIVKILDNAQNDDPIPKAPTDVNVNANVTEKDKLIRNTVFTQARGRLLHDKSVTTNEILPQEKTDLKDGKDTSTLKDGNAASTDTETPKNETKNTENSESTIKVTVKPENTIPINKIDETDTQIKTNDVSKIVKEESEETKQIVDIKEEKLNGDEKIVIKKEKDMILTHVLDGYVIQESSFAFPIRKPLKEKTLYTNTQADDSSNKDGAKPAPVDLPLLPFHYLHLNNERLQDTSKKTNGKDEKDHKDNPFSCLQQTVVKSWTIDQLASHLSKHDWKETVSVFQDHEIDGESLFLVSKSQLLTIGVGEDHADLICEFVKS